MDGSTKSLKIDDINSCQRMRGEQSCACAKLFRALWCVENKMKLFILSFVKFNRRFDYV